MSYLGKGFGKLFACPHCEQLININKKEDQFWLRVYKHGPTPDPSKRCEGPCWLWCGKLHKSGHGAAAIMIDGKQKGMCASRLAWIYTYGDPGPDLCVCHKCDNPPCCNPAHLFLGTVADNVADKMSKGRQAKGSSQGGARLTEDQVIAIKKEAVKGNCPAVAKKYGVSASAILKIMNGETWKHIK